MRLVVVAFFLVCVAVVIPFLYWYRKRNPHPHFRPRLGEMVLVSILAFGFAGGASIFMGMLMGVDFDPEKMKQSMQRGTSGGSGRPVSPGGGFQDGSGRDPGRGTTNGTDDGGFKFPWEQ